MKKQIKRIRLGSLWALCACLALIWFFPAVMKGGSRETTLPRAQRQLVTVWIYGDALGASSWVKSCAVAYQKMHTGVNIWVRTVSKADMALLEEDYAHAAPDLMLFMAGEEVSPAWLVGETLPLCMAGYALVQRSETTVTPAPTSLFGVTPMPQKTAAITPVPRETWPQSLAADTGLGAWFLQEIGAPKGALLLPGEQVQELFLQGKVQSALLSTLQIRKLSAQGQGMDLLCAVPGSDLVLFGAVMREAEAPAGDFLRFLQDAQAQQKLSERGLFSPCGTVLYGVATPILQAVEAALEDGWRPEPLIWPREKMEKVHLGQLLYAAQ